MIETTLVLTWVAYSIIVVGLVQWLKSELPLQGKWKKLYGVMSIGIAFGAAYFGGGAHILLDWMGTLAIAQIGYDTILQTILKKLKGE